MTDLMPILGCTSSSMVWRSSLAAVLGWAAAGADALAEAVGEASARFPASAW